MANLEGHKLGRYRLRHQVGRGGMGEVYLAEDRERASHDPRCQVAIKVVRMAETTLSSDAEALRLFREGRFLTELQHPHIVPVYDDGVHDDLLFLVMPYMPDGSLDDAIHGRSRVRLDLPLALERVVDCVCQIGEALQYTHDKHVVHRDVKPGNVLVDVEADGHWHLLLADFGIARNVETMTHEAQWRGTVAYMAPEQFRGEISPAVDQYALGVLAFELLTGQVPWAMQPPAVRTLNPSVSPAVEAVLLQALAVRPEERFASVAAFAGALRSAAAGHDVTLPDDVTLSDDRDAEDAWATKPAQWHRPRQQYPTPSGRRRRLGLVTAAIIVAMIATSWGILLNAKHLAVGSGRGTPPAGAAVLQGSVYVGDHVGAENTNGPATVYAYRASTGKLRWRQSLPCPLVAQVVAGAGMVYAYTAPCSQRHAAVYALRSSDGALVWVYMLVAPWESAPPSDSSVLGDGPVPLVFNGVVYLSSANYDNAKSSSPLGSIFAIDALRVLDGRPLWHVQMTGYGYAPAPVVVGSTLCLAILAAGLNLVHIYGLSLTDGHTKWQDTVPSTLSKYPAFQTGDAAMLYTSFAQQGSQASGVAARNATNGTTVWQTALAEYGVLVVSDGTLFDMGSPSLYAVRTDTGTVLWHTDQYSNAIAITVGSKKLYLGTGDGMVRALSAGDGHPVWQARVSGAAVDDLTATSDGVFVSSTGGYLDAFAAGDGARIWSARIDQQHPSPPAVGP